MRKIILILIIVIISLILILLNINNILKLVYRQDYSEYVEKYAKENNIDSLLIYAIIKAESNFDPNVKSNADARGLMQLMEETAVERSNAIEGTEIEAYDLYDPETNIKLGTSYFAYLLGLYDDNIVLAIIAYNAGLGNVEQWIKDGVIKADGSDIENIPYKETENYVRKILRDYQMYLKLYE